jgi:hypothetical protein
MKKNLRGTLSSKSIAPVVTLASAIKQGISGLHAVGRDSSRPLNPQGPGGIAFVAEIQTHADLAGGAISMPGEDITSLVYAEVGISRVQAEAASLL